MEILIKTDNLRNLLSFPYDYYSENDNIDNNRTALEIFYDILPDKKYSGDIFSQYNFN